MSGKPHIVADMDIPFLKGVLEPYSSVDYVLGSKIDAETIKNADGLIIRTRTKCNESLLKHSNVRFIATATIGTDHIDADYCNKAGIVFQNAPGCNSGSVMQYVASALTRLALKYQMKLSGMTLGVIGHGNVGSKVARLGRILGMRVLVNDPPLERSGVKGDFVGLEEVKKHSDLISFHVPLNRAGTDKTWHMANDGFFNDLTKPTFLINTSRGEVIETDSLKKAIREGIVKGSVLDVWENEPEIDRELLEMVDLGTPHIAGYSADGKANGTAASVRGVSHFFKLDLDHWYPESLPSPSNPRLLVDGSGLDVENTMCELILSTYDVEKDDSRLRSDIDSFELQRAQYPVRREFGAFEVQISGPSENHRNKIEKLGFRIRS